VVQPHLVRIVHATDGQKRGAIVRRNEIHFGRHVGLDAPGEAMEHGIVDRSGQGEVCLGNRLASRSCGSGAIAPLSRANRWVRRCNAGSASEVEADLLGFVCHGHQASNIKICVFRARKYRRCRPS